MRGTWRIRVDPTRCNGRGLCAEIAPELIQLDDWGFPIITSTPVRGALARHARRAVAACPELALFLEQVRDHDAEAAPGPPRHAPSGPPGRDGPAGPPPSPGTSALWCPAGLASASPCTSTTESEAPPGERKIGAPRT